MHTKNVKKDIGSIFGTSLVMWGVWAIAFAVVFYVGSQIQLYVTFLNVPSGAISDGMRWGVVGAAFMSWGWITLVVGLVVAFAFAVYITTHP